jgi:ubiquinone/menaquinone biosynthesis C-methylase UbiE
VALLARKGNSALSSGGEDYDKASKIYAKNRISVGLGGILGACQINDIKPSNSSIVDLGCGSGNYLTALSPYFKHCVGLDMSRGQIDQARLKVEALDATNIELFVCDARQVPLTTGSFDVALVSLMLHHVRSSDSDHFIEQQKVLDEATRLLNDCSIVIISSCRDHQIERGAWYCELFPKRVIDQRKSFYPSLDVLQAHLKKRGFDWHSQFVDTGSLLHGDDVGNYLEFLDPEHRRVDSIFSSLLPRETENFENKVRLLESQGKLKAIVDENLSFLRIAGQTTFDVFRRHRRR